MADFYRGFAYELDVHGRLTIEGNPVDADPCRGAESGASMVANNTLEQRAKEYIETSGWLDARERTKKDHLEELKKGCEGWNRWRRRHPEIQPILTDHDFTKVDPRPTLDGFDFSYTNFTGSCLSGMSLQRANFHQAILARAKLSGAHLEGSNFCRTDLYETDLAGAHLTGSNLQGVQLAKTNLTGAHLSGCRVYGLSAWDLKLEGADQGNLLVLYDELVGGQELARQARVDGIDVASFMYFTLNNKNIARIIGATTKQWVLLLGRFTVHKEVLEQLARALRQRHFIPIIFDFERSQQRDLVESIILLGGLSRLVIVDISDPRSTPLELHAIVPNFDVPVLPIMREGTEPFGVFSGLLKFPWVRRPPFAYRDEQHLVGELDALIAESERARPEP
jgi:hypothetical protein